MTDPVLALLVVIILVLFLLGAVSAALPGTIRQATGFVAAGASGFGALLALLSLTVAATDATLELPIGPPGIGFTLSCDPLSGFFLLILFLTGTAVIVFATETEAASDPATLAGPVVCVAGLGLALLATDGILLGFGIAVASLALWATGEPGPVRRTQLGAGLLAAGAMVVVSALGASALGVPSLGISPPGIPTLGIPLLGSTPGIPTPGTAIPALGMPPLGTPSAPAVSPMAGWSRLPTHLAFALALVGVGALAGLAPLHRWLVAAPAAMPARAGTLLCGAMVPVALYCLMRMIVSGSGMEFAPWWGTLLIILGASSGVVGAWVAAREPTLATIPAALSCRQTGLSVIGIGLTLFALATDLPGMARLALSAVFLLVVGQALCTTALMLVSGAVLGSAGSLRLDRLGGLIHRMPLTTSCVLAALFGLVALPPGLGFAAAWLLIQAALAALRSTTVLPPILFVGLIASIALSTSIALAAAVRLIGVGFLGRPRTPRSSVAEEIARPARPVLLALAGLSLCVGLFPGIVLAVLADPAIRLLSGGRGDPVPATLALLPLEGEVGYVPVAIAALLALGAAVTIGLLRRLGMDQRDGPAWQDGFARAPAWLPFGDPLTQTDGRGFVPDLPAIRIMRRRRIRLPRLTGQLTAGHAVLALVVGLLMIAVWIETL